jgi:two-component system, OmpR family, sensor kinase
LYALEKLFERFVRGPGSWGLGLGLYLARQIATAHGGTLEAESSPGMGARFVLALPADLEQPGP